MRLYKRGKTWWFALEFEGKRYQKATKERNRVKAEGIAAAYRTALAEGRVGIVERKPVPVFKQAVQAFLDWSKLEHTEHPATYERYRTSTKSLLAFLRFKNTAIDEITPGMIEEFKAWRARQKGQRTKRPIKPATVNRELACLKAVFFHAIKNRHGFGNPVSEVAFLREDSEQTRVISFDEQRRYVAGASETLQDVAGMILETGMRPEEVYRLKVENVFLDQRYLFIPFGKTKAARRKIPLTSNALTILKRRVQAAGGSNLFPHRKDPNKPTVKVNNAHTRALTKSGVRYFRLYDLRHTWATRAAEGGMDVTTLAALLGHSKLNMVTRYAHPQEQHQADAVRKLEAFNAAKEIAEYEKAATISATSRKGPAKGEPLSH